MKTLFIVGMVAFLGVSTAYGAVTLLKSTKIAEIRVGTEFLEVRKMVDGDTTCYITTMGKFSAHGISCVK